ncbi:MAG: DUF4476 domain-containing protein [Bacteroidia bacterium]
MNCPTAISAAQFQQLKRNLQSRANLTDKFNTAASNLKSSCLTSLQILEVLNMFAEDRDRLELAMLAYPQLVNKSDVYDLYNAFAYFSTAFRFHDYVFEQTALSNPSVPTQNPVLTQPPVQIAFPALNYPNAALYQGRNNCSLPLSDGDFTIYLRDFVSQPTEQLKVEASKRIASENCLTTAQAMKLSTLFQAEQNRLNFLKLAYRNIYDEANFDASVEVFAFIPNKNALLEYVNNIRATIGQNVPAPCDLDDAKFSQVKSIIARENSSSSRMSIAKNQLPMFNCYTSKQMKIIVNLFTSSSDKLEISKFAFDYVIDKENYFFEISPVFNSSMDRQALSNFIASKPN